VSPAERIFFSRTTTALMCFRSYLLRVASSSAIRMKYSFHLHRACISASQEYDTTRKGQKDKKTIVRKQKKWLLPSIGLPFQLFDLYVYG
jgi:hypothetical protein